MIKFFRGLRSAYNQTTHGQGIYFAIDTLEILHGGNSYSGLLEHDKSVKDITLVNGVMTITYTDNTTSTLEVGSGSYASAIEDKDLTMPNAVGGIAKGTKLSDIEGKSYDAIFDDLLFPTVNPTFTAPSVSLKLDDNKTSIVEEVGGVDISGVVLDVVVTFNKGAINLNGVKQNDRSGNLNEESSFYFYDEVSTNTTFPAQSELGNHTITYRAYYAEGPQPKDNKGNNYSSPLAAGYVDSNKITINGTYPWYASTDASGVVKQALVAWDTTVGTMSTGNFTLQPSGTTPQVFVLPRQLKTLQMLNTVSNQMETIGTTEWTETTSEGYNNTHPKQTHYIYTYNGAARGSVTLLAKF